MALKLPPSYEKGEPRSLIEAEQANMLLKALAALATVQVSPQGFGKVLVGETGVVIDLNSLQDAIVSLVKDALTQAGVGSGTSLESRVTTIENRLNNASASGTCNPGGGLDISFTI